MYCRLCGGPSDHVLSYDLGHLQPGWWGRGVSTLIEIRRCRTHGTWFTSAPPAPEDLASQYAVTPVEEYYDDPLHDPKVRVASGLAWMREQLPDRGALVDVGGGNGAFARAAFLAGYDAALSEVCDLNEEPLRQAGIDVVGPLDESHAGRFDIATLWDVYEHVWPHHSFLAPIHRALRPGGHLVIEVPTPSHLTPMFAAAATMSDPATAARYAAHICSYTHLQLMTESELRATLPNYGFEVVATQTLSALSYKGEAYVRRFVPHAGAAQWLGGLFDRHAFRRVVIGTNKLRLICRRIAEPAVLDMPKQVVRAWDLHDRAA